MDTDNTSIDEEESPSPQPQNQQQSNASTALTGTTTTTSSLFPLSSNSLSNTSTSTPSRSQWLSNFSFTANLTTINENVVSIQNQYATTTTAAESESEDELEFNRQSDSKAGASYELIESSESDRERRKESKRKKRKRRTSKEKREKGDGVGFGSRKSDVRVWSESECKPNKEYYFDTRGDRDNLAFGCLYRMDVARYKLFNLEKTFGLGFRGLYGQKGTGFDRDADIDALDSKLRSAGRYCSSKFSALESHKSYKSIRILAPRNSSVILTGDFIPLSEPETLEGGIDSGLIGRTLVLEESWEDEILRKTREFNKLTREHPHDEKVWLEFAKFQDKVASRQRQKGARLQTLEKKISILEKANELNPDNEELLLCLLKAYQSRDSSDVLIGRWQKILIQHSGNFNLWRGFLRVLQGDFSRFKVSDMRKMYSHAIQALSSACSKQFRQVHQTAKSAPDRTSIQLELGLVDIFLSLCRFEWHAGYQELATALLQAEVEYTLFCPSLLLTEQDKHRLFEHFWSSGSARVGEEGAVGWSTWLEKDEEDRQRVIREESSRESEGGGWTGWSELLSRHDEASNLEESLNSTAEEVIEDIEPEDTKPEDDTESMLKMLGIDVGAGAVDDVEDTSTWAKWSEEELSRDLNQWMPLHSKEGFPHSDEKHDRDEDEQILRFILYEDVCEYLFTLSSEEARLSLVTQFVDFFGGKISLRLCTNESTWMEKILSHEEFPDSLLEHLRSVNDVLMNSQAASNVTIESLLSSKNDFQHQANMMGFLRNATLLCLTAFPRNYHLQEVVFVAEELSVSKMNSLRHVATPSRSLAKSLLKNDRQDLLLCGVYAQREAAFGNIYHARRVFDMALSSIEVHHIDGESNAPLLYFWYAEVELANNAENVSESTSRAMHILSCLGSSVAYSPFKSQPSNLQILRARQGFKERIKTVRTAWMRGFVDDSTVALICSAALFEELAAGWAAGIEVIDQAFSMVLPERRSHCHHLEFLFNYYTGVLLRHHEQLGLSKVWDSVLQGLQIYPFSPNLYTSLVKICHPYASPNKLRWTLDDFCQKRPSVIVWLFALAFEICKGGSDHRIRGLFERALANDQLHMSVLLWRCYIAYEIDIAQRPSAARRVFFRAIHACPWSKKLWLDGFLKLNSVLTVKELSDLQEVMRDKELNLRTDIYEILLQEETIP